MGKRERYSSSERLDLVNYMSYILPSLEEEYVKLCSKSFDSLALERAKKYLDNFREVINNGGYPPKCFKSSSYLITISFDDKKVDPSCLDTIIISKLNAKKKVPWYCFSIEQRSEDINEMRGFHTHIIVNLESPKRPSHLKREFYSAFKSFVENDRFVDVRNIKSDNGVEDYLLGIKKDASKQLKVRVDKFMREKYNFSDIYYAEEVNSTKEE